VPGSDHVHPDLRQPDPARVRHGRGGADELCSPASRIPGCLSGTSISRLSYQKAVMFIGSRHVYRKPKLSSCLGPAGTASCAATTAAAPPNSDAAGPRSGSGSSADGSGNSGSGSGSGTAIGTAIRGSCIGIANSGSRGQCLEPAVQGGSCIGIAIGGSCIGIAIGGSCSGSTTIRGSAACPHLRPAPHWGRCSANQSSIAHPQAGQAAPHTAFSPCRARQADFRWQFVRGANLDVSIKLPYLHKSMPSVSQSRLCKYTNLLLFGIALCRARTRPMLRWRMCQLKKARPSRIRQARVEKKPSLS